MTTHPNDVSRRSFIRLALAGSAGAVVLNSSDAFASGPARTVLARTESGADLLKLSIGEAAELVRKKKVSPVDLTRACLAQIDTLNPKLNAFITVTAESALTDARQAEREVQRGKWREIGRASCREEAR